MDWLFLALLCAFSLATADAATKAWLGSYSAREISLVRLGLTGVLMLPLIGDPRGWLVYPLELWGWVAAMLPLEIGAMLLYMKSIRDYPLSLTLPYLAFTPVFVILTGFLLLGERVSVLGGLGILLVVAGVWILNVEHADLRDWRGWTAPLKAVLINTGSRMMLAVALLYSMTATMGKGAMQYMPSDQFGAFYFLLLGAAALVIFVLPAPRTLVRVWRRPWAVLTVSAFNAVMVYTHFLALQLVEVAYMITVKRTSLLFGILYGALLFRERGLGPHLLAGILMICGVFLILY
jgi:drug/metabolite transporter (DMT)-like permease